MKILRFFLLFFLVSCSTSAFVPESTVSNSRSFHNFSAHLLSGEEVNFSKFQDNVVLLANIALKCGTTPQLNELQQLHEKYSNKGLVVLAFPSNSFTGATEPTDSRDINSICTENFGVTFPVFELSSCAGHDTSEVFAFLTTDLEESMKGPVSFNFEKFLIDKSGKIRHRFGSFTGATSDVVIESVEKLLDE